MAYMNRNRRSEAHGKCAKRGNKQALKPQLIKGVGSRDRMLNIGSYESSYTIMYILVTGMDITFVHKYQKLEPLYNPPF